MGSFTESTVEQAALAWFESVGWSVRHSAEIAPGELAAERSDYGQVVLEQRLRDALAQLNRSLPAAVNLSPALPYDCQVNDAQGNLLGRIAWTPGSPGTLTISGTLFFDGDIVFQNLVNAVYVGRATIYASGTISLQNSSTLCGVAGCDSSWNATQNLLAFVAGSSTDTVGFSIANSSTFQGAIYAVNDYSEQNGTSVWGPIIARQVSLENNTQNHYVPLGTLLGGMPQSSKEAVSIVNEPGSWG